MLVHGLLNEFQRQSIVQPTCTWHFCRPFSHIYQPPPVQTRRPRLEEAPRHQERPSRHLHRKHDAQGRKRVQHWRSKLYLRRHAGLHERAGRAAEFTK
jgi:hypothetical protein